MQGKLCRLDPAAVTYNIAHCTEDYFSGGEAAVHVVRWRKPPAACPAAPGAATSSQAAAVCPIMDGERVAIKIYHRPDGRGGFLPVNSANSWRDERGCCRRRHRINSGSAPPAHACWTIWLRTRSCLADYVRTQLLRAVFFGVKSLRHEVNM